MDKLTLGNYEPKAGLYSGKAATKKPKLFSAKIHFLDLIRAGIDKAVPYQIDFFVSIAQWLKRKGFQGGWNRDTVFTFFMDALFSVGCNLNAKNCELRKSLELFGEVQLKGLNYYRNYASIPFIEPFNESFIAAEKRILGKFQNEKLRVSYNPSHKDTVWILEKEIYIYENSFVYAVRYSDENEYTDAKNGRSSANWQFFIDSYEGENYIDFCLRLSRNYQYILSRNMRALKQKENGWHTYELLDNSKEVKGTFLTRAAWGFNHFAENENVGKLIDKITGVHIEEFAAVNMEIALQTLIAATDLPFNTPNEEGEFICYLPNDKVPCLVKVWYVQDDEYWEASVHVINENGEIDNDCFYTHN